MNAIHTLSIQLPSPLQSLGTKFFGPANKAEVWVKRDDLIHVIISGNKWRKLKFILETWKDSPYSKIVSFGGGYSNHLHALGYACHLLKIPFVAMIRGNYENRFTPMLSDLHIWNSQLRWLSKADYAQKNDAGWLENQIDDYQDCLVIPEGGSAMSVHLGMTELVKELPEELDYLLCPVGSGGTLAGVIQAMQKLKRKTRVLGIAVLKGQGYLEELVSSLVKDEHALKEYPWQILHDYHFGGYAKAPEELIAFCSQFTRQTQIEIEPVYSGKLFYSLVDLLNQGYFPDGAKVCALHSGGLQGSRQVIE